jgi:hypothetical protein
MDTIDARQSLPGSPDSQAGAIVGDLRNERAGLPNERLVDICPACDRPVVDRPMSTHACEYFRE